jgi:hypothetical protein
LGLLRDSPATSTDADVFATDDHASENTPVIGIVAKQAGLRYLGDRMPCLRHDRHIAVEGSTVRFEFRAKADIAAEPISDISDLSPNEAAIIVFPRRRLETQAKGSCK